VEALTESDSLQLDKMLNSCAGVGVGGGTGGGTVCGDCDSGYKLTPQPISFGTIPLNKYVKFRTAGKYTCTASSATITTASPDEKIRTALSVESAPLVLTIVDDPGWSKTAAASYADAFKRNCLDDHVASANSLRCFEIAERITYLDTRESLATEVNFYDGRSHGWETGFWDAIQHSSFPRDALRLMTARMQERDFEASAGIIESLTRRDLLADFPDAPQSSPALYHAAALEKLRKYVRLLGSSLLRKSPDVAAESVKTYRFFAEQTYCESQPLISKAERDQALAWAKVKP
jgi:hypothetical protein